MIITRFLVFVLFILSSKCDDIQVRIDQKTGEYNVTINNSVWFRSASTSLYVNNQWYTSTDDSLRLIDIHFESGNDRNLGKWNETQLIYNLNLNETTTNITGRIRQWELFSAITFHLDTGSLNLINTIPLSINQVRTVFPSFRIEQIDANDNRGYFTFEGVMMGYDDIRAGKWIASNTIVNSSMEAGPVVIFNLTDQGEKDVVILSPFSQFMATAFSQQANIFQYGVFGSILQIPANYHHSMILFYSSQGINKGIHQWGQLMKQAYNRTDQFRLNDITLNYLGYYTDAGAYYYYNTEVGLNYQDTILSIYRNIKLPFHYIQFDSWWYYRGVKGGVSQWTSRPDVFPDGLPFLSRQLENMPLAAHNRWWAIDTIYFENYTFIMDDVNQMSLPLGNDSFWIDLLSEASHSWGLIMYEQDWMHAQTARFLPLITDINLGRQWLISMGQGAEKAQITIQYCSAYPRHALQALEIPRVTQARVSSDYTSHIVDHDIQWNIGITNMFADALGIAPSKDTFWSNMNEPGSSYKPSAMEPLPDREILMATLSTGPVGVGDGINFINKERIMRCCREDGLILKPDRPVTMINSFLADWAENNGELKGELYSTQTTIDNQTFHMIFASGMQVDYSIIPTKINAQSGIIWSYDNFTDISAFDEQHPLHVFANKCDNSSFCLWYLSPLWQFNDVNQTKYAFMGESNKWTYVSRQRFRSIDTNVERTQTIISIEGASNENISLVVFHSTIGIQHLDCIVSSSTDVSQVKLTITPTRIDCIH